MAGVLTTLFIQQLGYFNAGNYNALTASLHPNAIMNEVDWPYGVHLGASNIVSYLNTSQATSNPQLVVNPSTIQESIFGDHGQVTGSDGVFWDKGPSTASPTEPVLVRYVFHYRLVSSNWLLISATATKKQT